MPDIALPSLILASASPRRRELLHQTGVRFRVVQSEMDEEGIHADTPDALARTLAQAKAAIVSSAFPESCVLAADTLVAVGQEVLGKPKNREEARKMLRMLSGITHQVITGVAFLWKEREIRLVYAISTDVHFKVLSDTDIAWYTATDEPYDKAGAYAIQGLAAHFIRSICGSYTNVVGLPVCEVMESLAQIGILSQRSGPT